MLMDNKSTSTSINIDNQWSSIYIFIVSNYGLSNYYLSKDKMHLHAIIQPWGVEVVVAFAIKEFAERHPKFTSRKRWKINS